LRTYGGVPRSQKVLLGLGGGPREKYSLVEENWNCSGIKMEFKGR